jgi:hypothetical protein
MLTGYPPDPDWLKRTMANLKANVSRSERPDEDEHWPIQGAMVRQQVDDATRRRFNVWNVSKLPR